MARHLKLFRLRDAGWVVETTDGVFRLEGSWLDLAHAAPKLGAAVRIEADDLVAPVEPTKVVCVGLNYAQHAEEMNKQVPPEPLLFMKPTTAITAPGAPIRLPAQSEEVHHEGELAIVIGRRLSGASVEEAREGIFGYSCANDVTARDIQRREKRYTRAKGYDSFCPIGPCVVLASDWQPGSQELEVRVNGERRQHSRLDDFIFGVEVVVSFISSIMTLLPGDVVLTGTPSGVGPLHAGDVVEVDIDGIGTLRNPVS